MIMPNIHVSPALLNTTQKLASQPLSSPIRKLAEWPVTHTSKVVPREEQGSVTYLGAFCVWCNTLSVFWKPASKPEYEN